MTHIFIPNKKLLFPAKDRELGMVQQIEQMIRMVCHKVNAHGEIVHSREVAHFPNLITDFGLNRIGSNSGSAAYCQVGTGTTPPTFGDSALVARVASSNTEDSSNRSQQIVAGPPRFSSHVSMRRFAAGVAAGTLSEVGFGATSTGQLWNRALIRDGSGNPTTITVLSDEILDVYLETRVYIPTGDSAPVVLNLGGVDYTFVRRPVRNSVVNTVGGNAQGWGITNTPSGLGIPSLSGGTGTVTGQDRGSAAYNGAMVGENGVEPTGSVSGAAATNAAYVNSSLQRAGTLTWDITRGNLAGGISAFTAITGWSAWQFSVSPAIPKTSSQMLSLDIVQSWGRH